MSSFVYLASQSPRRQDLLKQIDVQFRLLAPDRDEDSEALETLHPGESARRYVIRVAVLKAGAAVVRLRRRGWPTAPILAADTTVALDRTVLGKPATQADATRMLERLSGRQHRVLTAVALTDGRRLSWMLSESRVTLCELSARTIRSYVASREPFDKAGGYAIQGRAAAFVRQVSGSFSGVVGLPLCETAQLLREYQVRF
jgi:septum formation protein